jgi:hypothetical protein
MKCFSFSNNTIIEGIPAEQYANTLDIPIITDASIRFYACESVGPLLAIAAKDRCRDLFCYGYTELIPDNGAGSLYPEGSYLLDLKIQEYKPVADDKCMIIQSTQDHILLGCIPDAMIHTTNGYITKNEDNLEFVEITEQDNKPHMQDNVIVLEA